MVLCDFRVVTAVAYEKKFYDMNFSKLGMMSSRTAFASSHSMPKRVAIVGGGLAGLSTAYHLLDIAEKSSRGIQITILDQAKVGEGGASSVAGGLIHPFSPRGKLIHFGLSALDQSNHLIEMAAKHQPKCIVRNNLYRVALNDKNVKQLQYTSKNYPHLATWLSKEDMNTKFDTETSMGGIELSNGCKVIHVPTYLKGLWDECKIKAHNSIDGSISWELQDAPNKFNQQLEQYDVVILSAGAGILNDQLISKEDQLPVQLVRGQSIEMTSEEDSGVSKDAFLCGKYVTPLPTSTKSSLQRYTIGATHEFKDVPLQKAEVIDELKSRTYQFTLKLWEKGKVDKLTTGIRVQSNRGQFGRMPIIGRYANNHSNTWIFTGLSSRGLIYHGIFGKMLASAILHDDEEKIRNEFAEFDWWKK